MSSDRGSVRSVLYVLTVLASFPAVLQSQAQTILSGRVTSESGAPLASGIESIVYMRLGASTNPQVE
jgi:hypothetical protein